MIYGRTEIDEDWADYQQLKLSHEALRELVGELAHYAGLQHACGCGEPDCEIDQRQEGVLALAKAVLK